MHEVAYLLPTHAPTLRAIRFESPNLTARKAGPERHRCLLHGFSSLWWADDSPGRLRDGRHRRSSSGRDARVSRPCCPMRYSAMGGRVCGCLVGFSYQTRSRAFRLSFGGVSSVMAGLEPQRARGLPVRFGFQFALLCEKPQVARFFACFGVGFVLDSEPV